MLSVRVWTTHLDAQSLISRAAINQGDVLERNQQVLLMKKIYSKAERVIGWLGSDENGGSLALRTLESFFGNAIRYPNDFEWVRRMPELLTITGTFTKDSGEKYQSNDRLEEMLALLKRPFWRRVWIVQEMVLSSELILLCGEEFMDLPEPDLLNKYISRLVIMPHKRPQSVPLHLWLRLIEGVHVFRLVDALQLQHLHRESQVYRVWEGTSGFIMARNLLQFHKTSDPRDHVYGLLGLIKLDIIPDYGEDMTVAEVYLEVARQCLRTELRNILSLAGIKQSCTEPESSTLDMPSWVPDLRISLPARLRLKRYPNSHAFPSNNGFRMQIVEHKWLKGPAATWDTVSRTERKTGWDLVEWDLAEDIDTEKADERAYPSGITRFEAMVVLWLGGCDESNLSELRLDSELFRSYKVIFYANIAKPWANKYGHHQILKLIGFTIGRNGLKSPPTEHRESYITRSRQLRYDMRCFHTEKGYIGFGSLTTEAGDLVCVLEGHKAPVLLRRRVSHFIFVGDCDVVGIMHGEVLEAVKRGEAEIMEIEIR